MRPDIAADPAWILPQWPEAPANLRVLTTRRTAGISQGPYADFNLAQHVGDDARAVAANRAWLRRAAGLPSEPLWLEQVHGADVVEHTGVAPPEPPRADAAVAFAPHRVCVVMTADCLPVVLADRGGTCVAVAHAGWRGLAGGVLEATIAALRVPADQLTAWLGPAISAAAFEVGVEVRDAFVGRHVAHAAAFERNSVGRYQADLYLLARQVLALAGVAGVRGGGRCTSAESHEFYSFRRDGGRTGRMATLAWLERDRPATS